MRSIWTIYVFGVFGAFVALEAYAVFAKQMTLTEWVRVVTVNNFLATSIVFVVGAVLLAAHFWFDVKPKL